MVSRCRDTNWGKQKNTGPHRQQSGLLATGPKGSRFREFGLARRSQGDDGTLDCQVYRESPRLPFGRAMGGQADRSTGGGWELGRRAGPEHESGRVAWLTLRHLRLDKES